MAKSKRTIDEIDNESDGGNIEYSDEEVPKSKKSKKEKAKTIGKPTVAEEEFWSLSTGGRNPKRVNITEFKDTKLINIREYYEKDDVYLPGKKGISLTLDQYKALLKAIPEVNKSLAAQGLRLDDDKEDDDEGEESEERPKKAATKVKREVKANIEFTSDEEE